jgi:hypothetical protein
MRTVNACVRKDDACIRTDEKKVGKVENEACRDDPRTGSRLGLASV